MKNWKKSNAWGQKLKMIKINRCRCECPDILESGGDIDNINCHKEVVKALHKMQFGKCCYCEKYINQEGHGQAIEHFRPKASNKFPELKNEWSNLLHACTDCNGKKLHRFPIDQNGNPLIIDPSDPDIDPEEYLHFYVDDTELLTFGGVKPKDNKEKGHVTISR